MNAQSKIVADNALSIAAPFEDEARELAADEHFDLTRRMEDSDPCVRSLIRDDYRYGETAEQHFENNRAHFLEKAREQYAVEVAA